MAEEKHEVPPAQEPEVMGWGELFQEFRGTLRATLGQQLPGEFWQHMRAARKERLLAVRSILDSKITHLDRQQKGAARKTTKMTEQ